MPDFNRVVLQGTLANGAEIWSTSCAFTDQAGSPVILPGDLSAWAGAIRDFLPTTLDGALGQALGGNAAITGVFCYYYAATGGPATSVGTVAVINGSGVGVAQQPLQTSAVLSLRTSLAGRRFRGRMYWPALAIAPSNLGTYTSATAGGLAEAGRDLLQDIADAAPVVGSFEPVVVSAAADAVTSVTSVAVGNVPDTQRRRRNSLIETYQVAPI